MKLNSVNKLKGIVTVAGDKSISHRAVMFGSIAKGITHIKNFLEGADCLSTISCFKAMGIDIEHNGSDVIVHGKGMHGLTKPDSILDVGNSGTTIRLMSGILVGQDFEVKITGDSSICKRPMGRIITPLSLMNADITTENNNNCAPLLIKGSSLKPITYHSPVASAQVKSSILLAGMYCDGETTVIEPHLSRNHSELMLTSLGASISTQNVDNGVSISIKHCDELIATDIDVPADISSAAYFIVAGLIVPNSEITIKNVGINPTRDGIIRVCKQMGADITIEEKSISSSEPVADITVKSSSLKGIEISGGIIPTLIDELPVIAIMACIANGTTIIKDAAELKVKESNRIDIMCNNLKAMGADITPTDDGMIIKGGKPLHGALIKTYDDHRIAMSFAIASLIAEGETVLDNPDCVNISFPDFYDKLEQLKK